MKKPKNLKAVEEIESQVQDFTEEIEILKQALEKIGEKEVLKKLFCDKKTIEAMLSGDCSEGVYERVRLRLS